MDLENFEEIITCGICLELFNEDSKHPRILPCGHSFCHSCLEQLLVQSPCCCTCKTRILVSDAKSIPVNFAIKSLLNIRGQIGIGLMSIRDISEPQTSKCQQLNRKYLSEGFCSEHDNFKEMRCMDCELWICSLCGLFQHKHCSTLLFVDYYKELKLQVSKKVEKELGERDAICDKLNKSLGILDEERKSIIEDIKRKELELKDREKRIEELESLKSEEKKYCDKLKQLQEMAETSSSGLEFSKTANELDRLLEEAKKQIPNGLQHFDLPHTLQALGTLCENEPVFVVEDRYGGTRYGKVAVKDERIWVHHFQLEKPEAKLYIFKDILIQFGKSTQLPRTVFLQLTPEGGIGNSCDIVIETEGDSQRADNFVLLCSALKDSSYLGFKMKYHSKFSSYRICPGPSSVAEGIRIDDCLTLVKDAGVYGMKEGDSWFCIVMKDDLSCSSSKFGAVVAGLQYLKDRQESFVVADSGLVI